jgi:pimeloyl-ACP methyl ester carboxylesterase
MVMKKALPAVALTAGLLVSGCRTPIGADRVGADAAFQQVHVSALQNGVPSYFSTHILSRYDLLDSFGKDPTEALEDLHAITCREADRDHLFAATELSYLAARRLGSRPHDLAAVVYAYLYLFSEASQGTEDPYDPRFRLVCDLYNRSLTESLKGEDGFVVLEEGVFELPFGTLEVRVSRPGFPWSQEEFDRFLPAAEFEVRGLRGRQRRPGLGAPLIAIRAPAKGPSRGPEGYLPPELKMAASAFLRLDGDRAELRSGRLAAALELYAPFNASEIEVVGRRVPLEADLTAPLAYTLEHGRIWDFEIGGFLSPDLPESGLFMMQPYTPGKIPVVFVHGTASSPARWAEMFNELGAYQGIRDRFQFWFFLYTTGNPILYSAHLLRQSLHEVVRTLDPSGKDSALRDMVVIGHSQGGILARLLTFSTGSTLWAGFSEKTLEDLDLSLEVKELLRRVTFFDRVPFVRRVVYIATPHRGSFVAARWTARLASSLVALPRNIVQTGVELFAKSEAAILKDELKEMPTSVGNMAPDSRFVRVLNTFSTPPEVKAHSIIAVEGSGPPEAGDDGVVEYESAHLDGVESEHIVRSGHSCQAHPLTIGEVRRILDEHAAGLRPSTNTATRSAAPRARGTP